MAHLFLLGLLVGWGVAIPIGPMNLEIIRRNLSYGLSSGLSFGIGIVSADLSYLSLLNMGVLLVLIHSKTVMLPLGIIGPILLLWFAYQAFRMPVSTYKASKIARQPLWRQTRDGYILTFLSPFTLLFWTSMSSTIAVSGSTTNTMLWTAFGVITGVTSWMVSLNLTLHITRHRLSPVLMHYLNRAGGVILVCFAFFGLWRTVHLI